MLLPAIIFISLGINAHFKYDLIIADFRLFLFLDNIQEGDRTQV